MYLFESTQSIAHFHGMLDEIEHYFSEYSFTSATSSAYIEDEYENVEMYAFENHFDKVPSQLQDFEHYVDILYNQPINVDDNTDQQIEPAYFSYNMPLWSDMFVEFSNDLETDVFYRKFIHLSKFDIDKTSNILKFLGSYRNFIYTFYNDKLFHFLKRHGILKTFNQVKYSYILNKTFSFSSLYIYIFSDKFIYTYKHYIHYVYNRYLTHHNRQSLKNIYVNKKFLLFSYYHKQFTRGTNNIFNIISRQTSYDGFSWYQVLPRIHKNFLLILFNINKKIFFIYKFIDQYLPNARLSKKSPIHKIYKNLSNKQSKLEEESNTFFINSLSPWQEDVYYTKYSYIYLIITIILGLLFWKAVDASLLYETFISILVKPWVYFYDYKDLINLIISKFYDKDFIYVLDTYFGPNSETFKEYCRLTAQLRVKPGEIYLFNKTFQYNHYARQLHYSHINRKLLYLYNKAFNMYTWFRVQWHQKRSKMKIQHGDLKLWALRKRRLYEDAVTYTKKYNKFEGLTLGNIHTTELKSKIIMKIRAYRRRYAEVVNSNMKYRLFNEGLFKFAKDYNDRARDQADKVAKSVFLTNKEHYTRSAKDQDNIEMEPLPENTFLYKTYLRDLTTKQKVLFDLTLKGKQKKLQTDDEKEVWFENTRKMYEFSLKRFYNKIKRLLPEAAEPFVSIAYLITKILADIYLIIRYLLKLISEYIYNKLYTVWPDTKDKVKDSVHPIQLWWESQKTKKLYEWFQSYKYRLMLYIPDLTTQQNHRLDISAVSPNARLLKEHLQPNEKIALTFQRFLSAMFTWTLEAVFWRRLTEERIDIVKEWQQNPAKSQAEVDDRPQKWNNGKPIS